MIIVCRTNHDPSTIMQSKEQNKELWLITAPTASLTKPIVSAPVLGQGKKEKKGKKQ